jgi:hypothetical protein
MLEGEEIEVAKSPIRIKLKPESGFKDIEKIISALHKKGFDTDNLSKEELLFMYCYGTTQTGFFPYLNLKAYNDEIIAGISAALDKVL